MDEIVAYVKQNGDWSNLHKYLTETLPDLRSNWVNFTIRVFVRGEYGDAVTLAIIAFAMDLNIVLWDAMEARVISRFDCGNTLVEAAYLTHKAYPLVDENTLKEIAKAEGHYDEVERENGQWSPATRPF